MCKSLKIKILICSLLLLVIGTVIFYCLNMINYVLLFGVVDLIVLGLLVNCIMLSDSLDAVFNRKYNKIIKTYETILVKSLNVPSLENKNLIYVESIENLVDAQMELRRPIYYFLEENTCTFILKAEDDCLVFILRKDENSISSMERDNKLTKKKETILDQKMLEELDKTTVFVVNDKMLKVSPVRDKDKLNSKDKIDDINDKISEEIEKNNKEIFNEIEKVKYSSKEVEEKLSNEIKEQIADKISSDIELEEKIINNIMGNILSKINEDKLSNKELENKISNEINNVKLEMEKKLTDSHTKIKKEIKNEIKVTEINKGLNKKSVEKPVKYIPKKKKNKETKVNSNAKKK